MMAQQKLNHAGDWIFFNNNIYNKTDNVRT